MSHLGFSKDELNIILKDFTVAEGDLGITNLFGDLVEFEFIGGGAGRYVYGYSSIVIKCPVGANGGEEQNSIELELWSIEQDMYLCPIMANMYDLIVLPRCVKLDCPPLENILLYMKYNDYSASEIKTIQAKIIYWNSRYNLIKQDLLKAASWALLNGRLVCIDYGCTHEIYRKYYKCDWGGIEGYIEDEEGVLLLPHEKLSINPSNLLN